MPKKRPAARRPGRPLKLNRELIRQLVEQLEKGNYASTACFAVGVHPTTFYEWLRCADEPGAAEIYVEFSYAVRGAMAQAEARDVAVIDAAAQAGDWRAAAWRLERRAPRRWAVEPRWVEETQQDIRNRLDRLKKAFAPDPFNNKNYEAALLAVTDPTDQELASRRAGEAPFPIKDTGPAR